jgi:hypothetical protein
MFLSLQQIRANRFCQPLPVHRWVKSFPDDDQCAVDIIRHRWPDGVHCPRCRSRNVFDVPTLNFTWHCYGCDPGGYRFGHLTGTVFEDAGVMTVLRRLLVGSRKTRARRMRPVPRQVGAPDQILGPRRSYWRSIARPPRS